MVFENEGREGQEVTHAMELKVLRSLLAQYLANIYQFHREVTEVDIIFKL